MAKMQPFWWFLKPPFIHPSYVCWYNGCENCADWTCPIGTCQIDNVDFKEHTGSILFSQDASISIPSLMSSCRYVGFWLKFSGAPGTLTTAVGIWTDAPPPGGYAYINFSQYSPTDFRVMLIVRTPIDYWSWYWTFDYRPYLNIWQWFEIWTWYNSVYNQSEFGFFRAGEDIGGAVLGGNVGNPITFKKTDVYGHRPMKFDYLRVATKEEYPPE